MTELALVITIFALVGLLAYTDYNNRRERQSLLNALKAKDAADYANLQLADKTKIEVNKETNPDLVPLSNLNDADFLDAIKNHGTEEE